MPRKTRKKKNQPANEEKPEENTVDTEKQLQNQVDELQGRVKALQMGCTNLEKNNDALKFRLDHAEIFRHSIITLIDSAPQVIAVKANPMLYGEFLHALRRSLT